MGDLTVCTLKHLLSQGNGLVNNRHICPNNVRYSEKDTPTSRGGVAVCRLDVSVYPGEESVGNCVLEAGAKAICLGESRSFLCPHTHTGPQSKHQGHKR